MIGKTRVSGSQEYRRQNPIAEVTLKTQYELKLKINGTYITPERDEDRFFINLYSGPRGKRSIDPITRQPGGRKPVTGKLSSFPEDDTVVQLVYDRQIEIPFAKVKKKALVQGRQ